MSRVEVQVTVLDSNRRFLGYVSAREARHLLRGGARPFTKATKDRPFTIMLTTEQDRDRERMKMGLLPQPQPRQPTTAQPTAAQPTDVNVLYAHRKSGEQLVNYWDTPKEVWVQNRSNMILSRELDTENGPVEFTVPKMDDPVCLTERFQFDVLKKSAQLRTLLSSTDPETGKPLLVLVDEAEVLKHMSKKARAARRFTAAGAPDIGWAVSDAQAKYRRTAQRAEKMQPTKPALGTPTQPTVFFEAKFELPETVKDRLTNGGAAGLDMSNPELLAQVMPQFEQQMRDIAQSAMAAAGGLPLGMAALSPTSGLIVSLCAQVDPELPFDQRMPESELNETLAPLWETLAVSDLERLMQHGGYPKVKAQAAKRYAQKVVARNAADDAAAFEADATSADVYLDADPDGAP